MQDWHYKLLADLVLASHLAVVCFVLVGLLLVFVGNALGWRWVNNLWFRLAHLLTILVVVAQAWMGLVCPLTTLEMWLRSLAGQSTYSGGFVAFWMQRLLYHDFPEWVFILIYTGFAGLVLASWWRYPPRFGAGRSAD
ncbi:MAG: DUF2784 domain-containing protein [Gammaproteobacteria bacterium HGW-Gammaproteobacteria-6]|nr:MAG: DUF2784 domain-containing protein [Gammaproteobacteria bacterium HGW-Gammaproteobacteria-6]